MICFDVFVRKENLVWFSFFYFNKIDC
jgi:hypothetical protein